MLITTLLFHSALSLAEPVTLNLKDADIGALIKTVSEHTGKNFVIDPRVKGKVTVISAHPMDEEEFYHVFLSILEVHGFSTIPSGNVIKIVPDVKAKQAGIPTINTLSSPNDQMVTQVIQIKNVAAAQLVPILRPLIPQQGHLAAYPATNVLIISDRAGNVERLNKIISRIDQVNDTSIDIVPLKYASAAEVVRVLNSLQQKTAKGGAEQVRLAADERTNSILLSGERTIRARMRVIIEQLDTEQETDGNTQVIYLKYANASELAKVLTGISDTLKDPKKSAKTAIKSSVSIQADEASNALIITAPPGLYRSLQGVIRKLDIRRAQVLVEAIIAEISVDKAKELGVQWIFDGTPAGKGPVGIIDFGGGSPIGAVAATAAAGGIPSIPSGTTLALGQFDNNTINFAALLRALDSDSASNILSTPSIMTLDNEEAEIVIGQNVPFVTGQYASTGGTGGVNPFQTIQRQDVGLTLRVTPQINEGDAVQLKIEQEASSINKTASSGTSDIVTNKRVIKTTVMVDDGQTIVLGGLMDETLEQVHQKVPLLGDLPFIGALFRSTQTVKVKRNLMIFLKPSIVRDAATQTQLTSEKYNFLRAQQLWTKERGVDLMSSEDVPIMPKRFVELPSPFGKVMGQPFE
ncbi:MAG: type II secretion system secretin GspD [Candidatus Polarisedimenticolaceae bacterium]|nr:type II secretion system secretin GspD [Candidatus Polarisedimenticolaceae bacterium]